MSTLDPKRRVHELQLADPCDFNSQLNKSIIREGLWLNNIVRFIPKSVNYFYFV